MSEDLSAIRDKWDRRHANAEDAGEVAVVLQRNSHLLPAQGDALDLACGRGASALWLAGRGLNVTAWDLSPVALKRLNSLAQAQGVMINGSVRDVISSPPAAQSFDLILVSYFLERALAPAIIEAIRPGGLLFYQTFSVNAVSDCGPTNPAYRLADNELLHLFAPLKIRCYREESRLGDCRQGIRDIAMLVAEKQIED